MVYIKRRGVNVKKTKVLSVSILSAAMLLLAACGNEEKASESPKENDSKAKTEETSNKGKTNEKAEESDTKSGEVLNPSIAEETEGNVEVVYTNKEPGFLNDINGFKVSVNEYQIVKVTDMNEDSKLRFDGQNNGYVVTTKVTIENGTDKPMYYNNNHKIQLSNEYDYIPSDWENSCT